MTLEQRAGRIDRIRQDRSVVDVINLFYEDTAEHDAYRAVERRFKGIVDNVGAYPPIIAANIRSIIRDGKDPDAELDKIAARNDFDVNRLNATYQRALALYQGGALPPALQEPYGGHLGVIVAHQEQNKAALAVLTTLMVKKLHTPEQDVRLHQAQLEGGFSGRGLDTRTVTPFLRDRQFPYMQSGSGWLTRSLEQSRPYDLDYPGNIRPATVKRAFLGLVDGVQCQGLPAENVLIGIIVGPIRFRDQNTNLVLSRPVNLSVAQVVDKLSRRHSLQLTGVARLPVLSMHAILTILVPEVVRYDNCAILSLEHQTPHHGRGRRTPGAAHHLLHGPIQPRERG